MLAVKVTWVNVERAWTLDRW